MNNVRIGYDGSTAYSGNILIEGNSLQQLSQQAGAGSIAVQTTGTLTVQSARTGFTQLRAGGGALGFDDDWNFGSSLAGFTLGKSTNTLGLTLSNALTAAGPIAITGGNVNLNASLTSTLAGAGIRVRSSGDIVANGNLSAAGDATLTFQADHDIRIASSANVAIAASGGKLNTVLWADANGSGGGTVYFGNQSETTTTTINTGGGHVWAGGGSGSAIWNGLNVGNGYANSDTGTASWDGVELRKTSITTAGGDVLLKGRNDRVVNTDARVGLYVSNSNVSTGAGSLTLDGQTTYRTGSVPSINVGVLIENSSSLASSDGAIAITGTQNGFNTEAEGVKLVNSSVSATGSGNLTITGTSDNDNGSVNATKSGIVLLASGANAVAKVSTNSG
ncbi:MAG: hypothetical protein Q7T55_09565, partial [Solirubrobacteraceae bacterium]|nr:hypothetical protein [Solirubrobacteraceae bacterium]